jgi:hypothetical protein
MGARNSAAATPVLLNVYDLTAANDYLYWLGFGVFHSGIEGSRGDLSSSPFFLYPFCGRMIGVDYQHGADFI